MNVDEIEINAPIMLITSIISLVCNIFMLKVLGHIPMPCFKKKQNYMDDITSIYKPHGGHNCGHDHGSGGNHEHNHHDHSHSQLVLNIYIYIYIISNK